MSKAKQAVRKKTGGPEASVPVEKGVHFTKIVFGETFTVIQSGPKQFPFRMSVKELEIT